MFSHPETAMAPKKRAISETPRRINPRYICPAPGRRDQKKVKNLLFLILKYLSQIKSVHQVAGLLAHLIYKGRGLPHQRGGLLPLGAGPKLPVKTPDTQKTMARQAATAMVPHWRRRRRRSRRRRVSITRGATGSRGVSSTSGESCAL